MNSKIRPLTIAAASAAAALLVAHADQDSAEDKESTAWLGVATAPVDEVVSAQLDLPEGVGAAVKIVVPDSPAESAGVKKNDILFEFDGEAINSPGHLSELVRDRNAGAEVMLGVIQRGQKKELSVALGARPDDLPEPQGAGAGVFGGEIDLGDLGGFDFKMLPLDGKPEDLAKHMEKMRQQMEKHFEGMLELEELDLPHALELGATTSRSMTMSDGNGSTEIRSKDGDTQVTAKDADGKVLFDGPANTEEERAKLPDHARAQLEKFEKSSVDLSFEGFRLGKPKMKVPELKPGKEVPETAPEEETEEVPPAEKGGKKVQL